MFYPPQLPDETDLNYERFKQWCLLHRDHPGMKLRWESEQLEISETLTYKLRSKHRWEERYANIPQDDEDLPEVKKSLDVVTDMMVKQKHDMSQNENPAKQTYHSDGHHVDRTSDGWKPPNTDNWRNDYFQAAAEIAATAPHVSKCINKLIVAVSNDMEVSRDLHMVATFGIKYFFPRGLMGLERVQDNISLEKVNQEIEALEAVISDDDDMK